MTSGFPPLNSCCLSHLFTEQISQSGQLLIALSWWNMCTFLPTKEILLRDNPANWQDSVSQGMFPKGIPADLVQELAGAPGWGRANRLCGCRIASPWLHTTFVCGSPRVTMERFSWVVEHAETSLSPCSQQLEKGPSSTVFKCPLPGHATVPEVPPMCSSARKARCTGIFSKDARSGLLTPSWAIFWE